jgi:fumarate hydratase class II
MQTRLEKDSMGEMTVPSDALYGASTQRAVLNFPISGYVFGRDFIYALGLLKWACAKVNHGLDRLSDDKLAIIAQVCDEVMEGKLDAHFPVDIFQTGSGTSTNMNINEVVANRASQILGKPIGSKDPIHPNDDVNKGQSSNDIIPTTIHIAVATALKEKLAPALERLRASLTAKKDEFWDVIKIGRTHLMDATPVRLGQEFGGYARQVELGIGRVKAAIAALEELPLGGTAVGTGLNCHPDFAKGAIALVAERTGINFREAADHFEAQGGKDGLVEASGQLKTIAVSLFKISNDLRWLSSGPRCGLGEIGLPATQPGSSIMPGKVNPVICESTMQVCAQVIGNDTAVTWGGANGNLELNVMMPLMAHNLAESIRLLTNVSDVLREKAVDGITANAEHCEKLIEWSMSMVTSLAPIIGYDKASDIAKRSVKEGKTVRALCLEMNVLPEAELNAALDPRTMLAPSVDGGLSGGAG